MATVFDFPLVAFKRVPFDGRIFRMGDDLTPATPRMEIRPEPGGSGSALVTLDASTAGSQGIIVSYDPDHPDPDGLMANGASVIRIIIDETTLEALSLGSPASSDVVLHYDIHLTPDGQKKFVLCSGTFTIKPGVTL